MRHPNTSGQAGEVLTGEVSPHPTQGQGMQQTLPSSEQRACMIAPSPPLAYLGEGRQVWQLHCMTLQAGGYTAREAQVLGGGGAVGKHVRPRYYGGGQ